jgi:hypothetical protein
MKCWNNLKCKFKTERVLIGFSLFAECKCKNANAKMDQSAFQKMTQVQIEKWNFFTR